MIIKRDPIEDDPRIRPSIEVSDIEAEKELENHPLRGEMGFCYIFWATKTRILEEKYSIDGKSPDEMNPDIIFD
jgi:hypothetical protein